jgi:hypothetical protein
LLIGKMKIEETSIITAIPNAIILFFVINVLNF